MAKKQTNMLKPARVKARRFTHSKSKESCRDHEDEEDGDDGVMISPSCTEKPLGALPHKGVSLTIECHKI